MHVAASQSIWCFICKWCSAMWLLTSPFLVAGLRSVSRVLRFLCRCRPSCRVLLFILAGKTTQYVYIILDSFSCQYEKQYSTRWKATAKNWKQVVHKEINIEHRLAERVWCLNPSPYLWVFTFDWVQPRVQLLDPVRLLLLRSKFLLTLGQKWQKLIRYVTIHYITSASRYRNRAENTTLMCEQKPFLSVLFSCRRKSYAVYSVIITSFSPYN